MSEKVQLYAEISYSWTRTERDYMMEPFAPDFQGLAEKAKRLMERLDNFEPHPSFLLARECLNVMYLMALESYEEQKKRAEWYEEFCKNESEEEK